MLKRLKNSLSQDLRAFLYHSRNYLTGQFIVKALGFLAIPFLTRMLTKKDFGFYSIFNSLVSIGVIIAGLGVSKGFTRYYFEKNKNYGAFVFSNLIFLFSYGFILVTITLLFSRHLALWIDIPQKLIIYAVFISVMLVPMQCYLAYLMAAKKSKENNIYLVSKDILVLFTSLIFIYWCNNNRYMGRVYGYVLISFFVFPIFIYKLIKLTIFKLEKKYIYYSLNLGIPFVFHLLATYILAFFDRILINYIKGPGAAGIYSLAYSVGLIMSVLIMALNKSWVPLFFTLLKDQKRKRIFNLAESYIKLVHLFAAGLVLFSKEIITILSDKNFHEAFKVFPIIIVSYIFVFMGTLYINYNLFHKKNWWITAGTIIAGTINIVLNYVFIPRYGYIAAAWTTLFSFFVLSIINYSIVKFVLKDENIIPFTLLIKYFSMFIVVLAPAVYIEFNIKINWLMFGLIKLATIIIFTLLLFRRRIVKMISKR